MCEKMVNITFKVVNTAYINVILSIVNVPATDKANVFIDSIYLQSLMPETEPATNLTKHRIVINSPVNTDYTEVNGTGATRSIYIVDTGANTGKQAIGGIGSGAGVDLEDGLIRSTDGTAQTYNVQIGQYVRTGDNVLNDFDFKAEYFTGENWVPIPQTDTSYTFVQTIGTVPTVYKTKITHNTDTAAIKNIAYLWSTVETSNVSTFTIGDHVYSVANGTLLLNPAGSATVGAIFSVQDQTDGIKIRILKVEQTATDNVNVNDVVTATIPALTYDLTVGNVLQLANPVLLSAFPESQFPFEFDLDWTRVKIKSFTRNYGGGSATVNPGSLAYTDPFTNWGFTSSIVPGAPNKVRVVFKIESDSATFTCENFVIAPDP